MILDKETEAIVNCIKSVKELEPDAKMRVLKYLVERFGHGANPIYISGPLENVANKPQDDPGYHKASHLLSEVNTDQVEIITETPIQDYPTLKDLLIKSYPKTEPEWILCYAFYSSKYGTDIFRKEDILEKYKENNRTTISTSANLSNNINRCIKRDWFKSVNNNDYVMKAEGIAYVKEVLRGNSVSKEVKPAKRKMNNTQKVEEYVP